MSKNIKVMVVEDSAVTRQLIKHLVEKSEDISVLIVAKNGEEAIKELKKSKEHIDIILLDIEMPIMDGITALPELHKVSPDSDVIVVSALSRKHAEITLNALRAGAVDYIAKDLSRESNDAVFERFSEEIISKIKTFYKRRNSSWKKIAVEKKKDEAEKEDAKSVPKEKSRPKKILWTPDRSYSAIAIAASTGGPRAIFDIFTDFEQLNIPIFLTVHMPSSFTSVFADQLGRISESICVEGRDNMPVQKNTMYVAPGDYHMLVEKNDDKKIVIRTNQDEAENYCRPAADPMLRSLSKIYGRNLLTIVLTGMGKDGLEGVREVVKEGGSVIVQDEDSSVVWGMPGAVAKADLCDAVMPLEQISQSLAKCR